MRGLPMSGRPMPRVRLACISAALLLCGVPAWAQTARGATTAPAVPSPAPTTGARFVESCQQSIESGVVPAGCQGPLYASEIERLKDDALRTQSAPLLTLLGDAYQSRRSGLSDIGQAYRWYLLGAVRGDPRAMQRLSELYRDGRGTQQDPVKALGYARLAQRLAGPGGATARQAATAIRNLGSDMAAEEIVLAERFASEIETHLRARGQVRGSVAAELPPGLEEPPPAGAAPAAAGDATPPRPSAAPALPGMGAVQTHGAPPYLQP